jgi:Zn-dependent M28 family amino/carboxypeptidase
VINIDGGGPWPLSHDMSASGTGQSELEDVIKDALATQGRTLSPDAEPEKGSFFRSDHFSLSKVGIPAISPDNGRDLVVGGTEGGQKLADDYVINRYHQPSDEWKPDWDLSGTVQDARALYIVGDTLANDDAWPNYYKDSEFRTLRDKDMQNQ